MELVTTKIVAMIAAYQISWEEQEGKVKICFGHRARTRQRFADLGC